jgi:hypothetical protein
MHHHAKVRRTSLLPQITRLLGFGGSEERKSNEPPINGSTKVKKNAPLPLLDQDGRAFSQTAMAQLAFAGKAAAIQ